MSVRQITLLLLASGRHCVCVCVCVCVVYICVCVCACACLYVCEVWLWSRRAGSGVRGASSGPEDLAHAQRRLSSPKACPDFFNKGCPRSSSEYNSAGGQPNVTQSHTQSVLVYVLALNFFSLQYSVWNSLIPPDQPANRGRSRERLRLSCALSLKR